MGILIEIAGPELEEDIEGVIERRIHEYSNYIEGFMHLNQRYDIWVRVSKKAYTHGFTTLAYVGKVMLGLLKNELPIIEQMQVTFFTDKEKIQARYADAKAIYEARDARARGLTDDDVDVFYGCALCQSFAPSHVCVITPQRYANCGAISWFDGRAAARIDPKGPIFPIEKGECLDPVRGEYTGINESAKKRSLGTVHRVYLYSAFAYPHTSCGCFEGIAFYIPEVEGFGIVMRGYKDVTVNGLPFSTMADSTAGGRQVDGFHGISLEYMRSPQVPCSGRGLCPGRVDAVRFKGADAGVHPGSTLFCDCHGKRGQHRERTQGLPLLACAPGHGAVEGRRGRTGERDKRLPCRSSPAVTSRSPRGVSRSSSRTPGSPQTG